MKFLLVIFLPLMLGFGPLTVSAETREHSEKPLVRVAMIMFPGFSELNEQGEPVGKTVQLTRKLLNQAGYQADIRIMPAARIVQGLQSGRVHLWPGIVQKPGLAGHTLATERDLGKAIINLYYRPGESVPELPAALAGKRLILITNFTFVESLIEDLRDPGLELEYVTSISHIGAVQMLLKGRGDYLLEYPSQVDAATRELGIEPLPWVRAAEQPIRFVLSLQSGYAAQLKADLDRAYDELAVQGIELDVALQ